MSTALITHSTTAAPLAALLPARRGVAWTVEPAPQLIRAGAAMSRLVQNGRALDVVELDGRVEVYADRADRFPVAPDVVVTETGPDSVAALAALVLRIVLPRLEREAARDTVVAHGREQVIIDGAQHLNEVGYALIDHGAHVDPVARPDGGVGIEWTAPNDAEWGLWVLPVNGNLTLTYDGPVSGLYALLPVLLPSADGYEPSEAAGSAFTRHLTDRFPQLRPLSDDEVQFGRRDDTSGYIALPASDEPTDYADDDRRVVASFSSLGADLLLTAVPHLV
ncbi:hypothetical protein SEA_GILGAMESH_133 [Streptomyces phage Gilgamesh]|uniref:Uncharacterized protein n=1 Tax=Streptomyces phage Gilgamesh TaxID=2599890 RepID=A0A5J6TRB0_9CAUD|nr:hypothetical protein QEH35_gp133 [Streptomyces phage Gilgamesh]QFG13325.1 hypothetical protein SEA_GILGAMESH_133 [Streptomyces phage Gilgamesh]